MIVNVIGGEINDKEKEAYVKHIIDNNPDREIDELTIELDGEYVNLSYHLKPIAFNRIRRITGYLTNMDRCNNAKRAEIADRTKHGIQQI